MVKVGSRMRSIRENGSTRKKHAQGPETIVTHNLSFEKKFLRKEKKLSSSYLTEKSTHFPKCNWERTLSRATTWQLCGSSAFKDDLLFVWQYLLRIVVFVLVNWGLQIHCQKKPAAGMCLYDDSTENRQNYKFQKLTARKSIKLHLSLV